MANVRAVILDIDGTLLLSNDAHALAFVEAAAELAVAGASFEEIRRMIGMGGDKLIPKAFGFEQESPEGEKLDERKGEIFRSRLAPGLRPAPGAADLVRRFRDEGLRRVVATSASEDDLSLLLEKAGVEGMIDDCTSSGDVDESKPEPDIVEAALEMTGVPAHSVVMIGDTPYDVEAATRAGVRIVAVRCGGWSDADLSGAVDIYDDPADLLANYESSVFGRG
jgi:HAD superfamily hydrolase (TIGR01509 family)